jgi:hypothetical protein
MKIALTILNSTNDDPMMVVEFAKYTELRNYWRTRAGKFKSFRIGRVTDDELADLRSQCVGLTPVVGDGWRRLEADELVQEGDEWFASTTGKWEPSRCAGQKPSPTTVYRRRFAGEGWRFLRDGEMIRIGDQYYRKAVVDTGGDDWWPTAISGGLFD